MNILRKVTMKDYGDGMMEYAEEVSFRCRQESSVLRYYSIERLKWLWNVKKYGANLVVFGDHDVLKHQGVSRRQCLPRCDPTGIFTVIANSAEAPLEK